MAPISERLAEIAKGLEAYAAELKAVDASVPPVASPAPAPIPSATGRPAGATADMKLVFEDQFNELSRKKWNLGPRWAANGNQHGFNLSELGWYNPSQVLADGMLHLKAEKKVTKAEGKQWQYLTGCITTAPDQYGVTLGDAGGWKPQPATFEFTYGWVEARMKLPAGKGLWPAFWLLQSDGVWPPEIDILEVLGDKPSVSEMHFHSSKGDNGGQSSAVDWSTDFHTVGVNWTPETITWYIDGKPARTAITDKAIIPSKPMYLLLNLAVGGDWPGAPDASTKFPAEMLVDWVRVWQKP